jgi:DNA-directed RNA polymerase specialized sigma24 family protein
VRTTLRFLDAVAGGPGGPALERAFGALDGDRRMVLALLFLEGLSEHEAATVLNRPVAAVRALAESAKHALAAEWLDRAA